MSSPFPGMNPYLEQPGVWHDFHQRFVPRIADALAAQIRPHYLTHVDDHVYIHELVVAGSWELGAERTEPGVGRAEQVVGVRSYSVLTAPAYGSIPPAVDQVRESFLEIRDRETREVVTVIELLSPTNKKPGPDREQYLGKRAVLLAGNTHVVEIDLLRGGERMPVEGVPECDYLVMVSRSYGRPRVELWPVGLREPLPTVPIPLKRDDADATINLQTLLSEQYDAAGYEDYIYRGELQPALSEADAKWASSVGRGECSTERGARSSETEGESE